KTIWSFWSRVLGISKSSCIRAAVFCCWAVNLLSRQYSCGGTLLAVLRKNFAWRVTTGLNNMNVLVVSLTIQDHAWKRRHSQIKCVPPNKDQILKIKIEFRNHHPHGHYCKCRSTSLG